MTIWRWDVAKRRLISEIKLASDLHGREFVQGTLRLSADGRRVIAATNDLVGIWDALTGQLVKKLSIPKVGDNDTIRLLSVTPDFSVIAGSLSTKYTRRTLVYDAHSVVWDGASGEVRRTITHKGGTHTIAISLSPDGRTLATTNGGGASLWDVSNGQLVRAVTNDNAGRKQSDADVASVYSNHVWGLQFAPDSKLLAIGDTLGVKLIETQSGKHPAVRSRMGLSLVRFKSQRSGSPSCSCSTVGFSPRANNLTLPDKSVFDTLRRLGNHIR